MKIRVFTAFSGYDSQCLALDRLCKAFPNFEYELVGWSEIDKYAIQAHNALYPQWADRNYGDISKVDWEQVPDFDLFTYSSPCFVAGTLILTEDGYKSIEDVMVGDKVLTHSRNYCEVKKVGFKFSSDIYRINAMMLDEITCTGEHPFYTREMYRYGHEGKRAFKSPQWTEAKDLTKKTYLGYAINTKSELPKWNGSIDNRWGHHREVNKLQQYLNNKRFWYVMGRYVGDGWKREGKSGKGITICCSQRNYKSLEKALQGLGWNYTKVNERTVTKMQISMKELNEFVSRYGYYAHGKRIDAETINLPHDLLKPFLYGVIDSDGCLTAGNYKLTSVSRELVYGLQQCIAKVYHCPVKMYKTIRPKTTVIEGRLVNQNDTYTLVWKTEKRKQDKAFYEDGYIWYPIKDVVKQGGVEVVYNIKVANDHSYTANGAIVHNCQDFSSAGLQRGGTEGSGTRSSLLWECRRAILAKKPKYLLLENVAALVSQKFLPLFNKWQAELESYGYTNYAQVLNSKDYGVPQNRDRIFLVSIRDEHPKYHFPKPFPLDRRLKDVLETDVDEKYYLSDTIVKGFEAHRKRMEERGNGFGFKPTDGNVVASSVLTNAGSRHCDNYIIEKDPRQMELFEKESEPLNPAEGGGSTDNKGAVLQE